MTIPCFDEHGGDLAGCIPDPADRRTKLVLPTDAAKAVTDTVHRFNQALEAGYRGKLGDRAYQALRAALLELAPIRDPQPRMPQGDAD